MDKNCGQNSMQKNIPNISSIESNYSPFIISTVTVVCTVYNVQFIVL